MNIVNTSTPPNVPNTKVAEATPTLLQSGHHHLCGGCGHPVAIRIILEAIEELGLTQKNICLLSHGCAGTFANNIDVDLTLSLHGRAPAVATGMKRMRPDCAIWTMQGDGDMVSEGLAEILHTAARGENITCFLLNNGVFGDTGGQMTAATVVGQRTKNTLEGRDPGYHGYPIPIANMVATLPGVAYVARGAVYSAGAAAQAKRAVIEGFKHQMAGNGFSLVEILTMCPTGWFIKTGEGPDYLQNTLEKNYPVTILRDVNQQAPAPT
jgi:2-oxoglutarate ferredoxin oxidoreductase subunit beta